MFYCACLNKNTRIIPYMPRVSFQIEILMKASPTIIYQFLTSPACLVRWFCDEADIQDDCYIFSWQGVPEVALIVDDIEDERLRLRWDYADKDEFLEFRIYKSDVTEQTILEITDFCDSNDVSDQKRLWESQIADMRKEMGG